MGILSGTNGKDPPVKSGDARDSVSILELGRPPGVGNCNPL